MMHCVNCGQALVAAAVACPFCGVGTANLQKQDSWWGVYFAVGWVLVVLAPLIAFLMGVGALFSDSETAKKSAVKLIIGSVAIVVVVFVLWIATASMGY